MKIHYKIQGIAAALSLCIASNFAQGQTIVTGWDKAGDTDGWALPAEQYLKDFPMVKSASQSGDVVNNGNGSLKLAVEISTDEKARRGRVDKFYGGKADWKRFTSFSIMCHVPAGAPQVQASIAVMSGAWKWTECKPVTRGACIGHVSPEAAEGGMIGLLQDGETLVIDIPGRTLDVKLDEATLGKRRAAQKPWTPRATSGWLRRYSQLVGNASSGATLQ